MLVNIKKQEIEKQEPLVSVIIPTYNRPDYLREAIASVVQQTYTNLEIIVSDDCSAQSPQAVVESFQDPRIRLRRNGQNLGIGWNATYAFKEAKGKYVATLNDDDLWHKNFLAKLIPPLEANPDLVLAFCDYHVVDPEGKIDLKSTEEQTRREKRDRLQAGTYQPFWKIALMDQAVFIASAAVIRKDAVDWDQVFKGGVFWDYYTAYLACRSGGGAYYCPERLSQYRESVQSILRSPDAQAKIRKARAALSCYEQFMEDDQLQTLKPYFQRKWAEENTSLGIGLLRAEQVMEARPCLFKALRQQKFNARTIVALALSFMPQTLASPFLQVRNVFAEHSNHL